MRTARVEALLEAIRQQGYWTHEQVREVYEMTGRDASYMPEGTEGWMEEDGVPRSYDRPRRALHTHELPTSDDVARDLRLDTPPPRPAEPAELPASSPVRRRTGKLTPLEPSDHEDRLKTMERR
jgi:hypothetical protein